MKAHCFQHESFEGMAAIEEWLRNKKFEVSYTRFYESAVLPEIDEIDWLIIMGGSMSVNDEMEFPWLDIEKSFIRKCIVAEKVVIGICLGSQLIANALGARVYPNREKEIGWFPVFKNPDVKSEIFRDFPKQLVVFHWHGETFDLPEGAELIASSEACKNQIFAYGTKTIGFQCHPETTSESLAALSEASRQELIPAPFIQSEKTMIEQEKKYSYQMHHVLFGILDELLS